jgi:hypothetical protein
MKQQVGSSKVKEIVLTAEEVSIIINQHVKKLMPTVSEMDYHNPIMFWLPDGGCAIRYFQSSIKTEEEAFEDQKAAIKMAGAT